MSAEAKLKELGIELPPAPPKGGVYKPVVYVDGLAFVSGHGPYQADETYMSGKVGSDLDLEAAQKAARQTGLALLATIRAELGSLDKVKRVIKLLGMVNAVPTFGEHPQVINGCSELFRDIFGEDGVGSRSAVGMGSLPGNIPVEIELTIEIER
ncbi:MAG: RidA family protein [Verrucomicrobiia bacterium]|jgi:enamine deaminase RidA (YjgF/YER057c/UK114 family)